MQGIKQRISPSIQQMTDLLEKNQSETKTSAKEALSFQDILENTAKQDATPTKNLRFSKHANERLATRQIELSSDQLERLETGTSKAREKGIQESLVMVDDLAFIVNVKNNTVITALGDASHEIVTNIDGAVFS